MARWMKGLIAIMLGLLGGPLRGAEVPLSLMNAGFESPALSAQNSFYNGVQNWTMQGAVGTTYELAWNFPASEGHQYVWGAASNCGLFQNLGLMQADTVYCLEIDLRPLPGSSGNNAQVFFQEMTGFQFPAQAAWHPAWNPGLEDFTLPADRWTTVWIGFSSAWYPDYVGKPFRVGLLGTQLAVDRVRVYKAVAPAGVDRYLSFSTGNDANDGLTSATAWKTFAPINRTILRPGDRVLLRRGDTWAASALKLRGKGTPGKPITLGAYGTGPHPVITGADRDRAVCVTLENPSWFNVDSLDCRDAKIGLYLRYTGGVGGGGFNNQQVNVRNCIFQGMNKVWSDSAGVVQVNSPYELAWGAGIWLGGTIANGGAADTSTVLDGLAVRYCHFIDVNTGVGNNWYWPIKYKSRVRNCVIEDCWAKGAENGGFALFYVDGGQVRRFDTISGGQGFYLAGTTNGFIQSSRNYAIEDCEFSGATRPSASNDGVGFDFEGDCDGMRFTDNVIGGNDGAGLLVLGSEGLHTSLVMNDNVYFNNCRNPKDLSQNWEIRFGAGGSTGQFRNNGIYRGQPQTMGTAGVYHRMDFLTNFEPQILSLNRSAVNYVDVSGRPSAWSFDDGLEGWVGFNQWPNPTVSGGRLTGQSSGPDPFVQSPPLWINTRAVHTLHLRLSVSGGGGAGQVFFLRETDPAWTQEKSLAFPLLADGEMHDYWLDLRQCANYRGVVTQIRLDPTTLAGASIALDEARFVHEPILTGLTVVDGRTIDVRLSDLMDPRAGALAAASYTLGGQPSLAPHPDTVTMLAGANGLVFRLEWSTGWLERRSSTLAVAGARNIRGVAVAAGESLAFRPEIAAQSAADPRAWTSY